MPTCLVTLWPQGVVPGVELAPAGLEQLRPAFTFANEVDSLVPHAHVNLNLGWPDSRDATAEVPGHCPVPSCLRRFSPAFFPDPQSRLPKA